MFYPVHDINPLRSIRFQYVTVGLIIINIIMFFVQSGVGELATMSFAIVPAELFGDGLFGTAPAPQRFDMMLLPDSWTLLTYMFLHGNTLHLAGNMLFLWVFGDNVEDAMGHVRFLIFYILCGVFAGFTHAIIAPASTSPLIGASGAIAGIIAAYLILHPRVNVWVLVFRILPLRIPAFWVLGAWVIMQFAAAIVPHATPVAWWAHVGGIIAGAVLVVFMRRPGVPLFDRSTSGV